eukprot:CAMPEP_0117591734 /NCGR_PEP_ID=MMETSP0784-20121206/71701_1 /TAXON_ID=39447 /ORGANISM="" /LENGTH=695 /DNA_ID=CAMNT_0005393497 /DNA_START=620 /DNA_END=2707 /DNA_ORIENTATION=-
MFALVVPNGAVQHLSAFVVEGSLDGTSWERIWPGPGAWGLDPGGADKWNAMSPVVKPNSLGAVEWFTLEPCTSAGTLFANDVCSPLATILSKEMHLDWHHHLAYARRIVLGLVLFSVGMLGAFRKPHWARPLVLGGTLLYGFATVAVAMGKLAKRELAQEWAEAPGIFLIEIGIAVCEVHLFCFLLTGIGLSLALIGGRDALCNLADLLEQDLVCTPRGTWQVEIAMSMSLFLVALVLMLKCLRHSAMKHSDPRSDEEAKWCDVVRFPPEGFRFLGVDGLAAETELLAFGVIRSIFDYDEDDYRELAHRLLIKVVSDGSKSTAKSGALMAFEEGLMAKSMTEDEVATLVAILKPYLAHLQDGERDGDGPATLLPHFLGAYVYEGRLGSRVSLVVTSNLFAGVPSETLKTMERFDLKGSSDDREQRREGSELMDFDLLKADRKLVPAVASDGKAFSAQLRRDTVFLLQQHAPMGPDGILHYELLPAAYRGAPGLMDYSLLVGVAPRGTPGGVFRLDVTDERMVAYPDDPNRWRVYAEERTVLVGIIDILQFWTPAKRAARLLKTGLGKERDLDGGYHGEILDTVRPEAYAARFLGFMQEVFAEGSWTESLPRMNGGDWSRVTSLQIHRLPEPQRNRALERQRAATARRRENDQHWRLDGLAALGCYSANADEPLRRGSGTPQSLVPATQVQDTSVS